MFINLHSHVLAKLAAREIPWTQVARDTGIPYETLKKIASGRTPNPGVQHVQKLADYFGGSLLASDRPAESESQAMPTPQEVFMKLADGLALQERRIGPTDRRMVKQQFDGPEKRISLVPHRTVDRRQVDIASEGQGV
ncbi:helix-turn-helix domain-containing protein [Polaromonas glacialis]|uniref:helix-turn-helix domain-containing protein n=1 Tax=Polaromonas glacialis TaxID=866564 RepID=UPI000495EB80|nr:helix-turn-helix transcriptional regulator [Polaromonas glacialis]